MTVSHTIAPQGLAPDVTVSPVSILGYSAAGGYEQCEAAMPWDGLDAPLRLLLVRNGERFDYRIRCPQTLAALFGSAAAISIDAHGPLVQISAQKGLSGAVVTGFPGLSDATLARIYQLCSDLCAAVAASGDARAAALARSLAHAARRPYGTA